MFLKRFAFGVGLVFVLSCATQAQTAPAALTATATVDTDRMRKQLADWANLARYRSEDEALPSPTKGEQRVVFLGDSITDRWGRKVGTFFPGKPYVNRGIGGQTTPQMLVRFQQDVVHLHPAAVVILAGTNDIALNTGPSSPAMVEDNMMSMVAIAKANDIKVVLASITPAAHYRWRPEINGVADIHEINRWLKSSMGWCFSTTTPRWPMKAERCSPACLPTRFIPQKRATRSLLR